MQEFYPFFIVVFVAVFFSTIFRRLHVPWVIALIVGGMIVGPQGIALFEQSEVVSFIGQIGLVFLMFMAGLESHLDQLSGAVKKTTTFALLNGGIPFVVGVLLGYYLGFDTFASLLLGSVFVSSSVAVIVPTLESLNLTNTNIGRTLLAGTMVEDVASLVFVSFLLQRIDPVAALPLPLFYLLLFMSLIFLRWLLPRLRMVLTWPHTKERDIFQQELRAIFAIMIGTVIVFEILGLHPIVGGFFAGLVLSGSIKTDILIEKLRTVSYGVFIPVFFVLVGAETDISLLQVDGVVPVVLLVCAASIGSKLLSGWIAGRALSFTNRESLMLGSASIPQLSTTLAVVFTGAELGILSREIVTAMVVLSLVTVFLSPFITRSLAKTTYAAYH